MQHAALGVVALVNRIRRELECILQNGPLTSSHTLVLQAKELQASVDALLSLSEQTQWHLAGGSLHGEQSQHMVPLYAACWQHVVDTQLLKLTAVVLERHRVPHVALGKAGDDKTVPEAIQVGPFHESLLQACALFIAGVRSEAAPPHLHRPVLEHLLVPSGFILLVADSLKALVQCAANHPRLLAEAEGGQQHQQEAAALLPSSRQKGGKITTTPQRYGAAAPQQQLRQTSGAARSSLRSHPSSACLAPMCSTPAVASYNSSPDTSRCAAAASVPDASFVAYARSAAHEVSLAAQEHPRHQHHHQPHSRAHCPLTGCSMHQQASFPDLHTQGPAAEAGRASGWLCTSLGTDAHPELFLKRGPHGRITAGLWQDGQGSDTGLLQQQQHQSSSSQGLLLEQPTLQSKGHISRRGAQCVLGILRDLNGIAGLEAATATDHASKEQLRVSERETKEALSRLLGIWTQPAFADVGGLMRGSVTVHEQRGLQAGAQVGAGIDTGRGSVADALVRMRSKSLAGGRDGVLGSASIALEELGASMLDVRAVLAGLLSEMKLLGQLVDLHRNAELAGCTKEDNLPYLEVITAIVASFNSPDLATSHSKHRNASTYTDPRLFSAVLEPAVVELSVEELCIVATSTFQSIEGFSDVPVARLPHELQGRLHLLHKLVASLVILSAAPLPPSTRTPLMPCSTTLSPSLNSMQRQPGTPTASPATVRNSDTSIKPISSAHFPPRPSSAGTSPYPFSPFRHIPTPPAALTPPHRPPSHSLPTPLVERPLAHASACSHPDSAPMLANSQKGAALQRTHSHATALGLTFSQGSPMANSSASKRSQLLESAHPDALPVMDAGLQGLQGGDGVGLQEEMYRGGSPTKEAVSLPDVVSALVLSGRIFAGFASCDIHFFNKATSTLMHTLKAVTKRLAAEGLDEHVEGIAVGLSQVLCSMTRAMGAAAQAAVHEEAHDQARQQEDLLEWERQRAKETWKAGGAQRGLFTLKPNQVLWSYVGKPHGWGAGANKGLGDTPLPRDPLTNHAWRLSNEGSLRTPMSSFNARPSSAAFSTSDRSQTTAGQSVSRPSSATSWASHRSPRGGSTAAASATPRLERLSEVDQDETLPEEQAESDGAANARGLDALWDALGYDANGNPLPQKAKEAKGLDGMSMGPRPWPGPSTQVIAHFEELLCDILSTLLHLVRGYLLPVRWKPRMKSPVRKSLALGLFQGTYVSPLPEETLLGSVPPSVASLWDGLARAGLLTSLELLFEQELLEDVLYVDPTAGLGAKMGKVKGVEGKGGKGAEYLQIDRVRVLSARLIADLLVSWPAAALEAQGAYLLRAVRKFLNARVQPAPHTSHSAHMLSTATSAASRSALCQADLNRATSSTAGSGGLHRGADISRSSTRARRTMGGAEEPQSVGVWRSVASGLSGRTGFSVAGSGLSAYTISSVAALAQELLPLTQMVMARAVTNTTPSPLLRGAWTSDEATSRAGILVLMHTWPPLMRAICALLSIATLPTASNDLEEAEGAVVAAAAAAAAKGAPSPRSKRDASPPDAAVPSPSLGPGAALATASADQASASQAAAAAAAAASATSAAAAAKSSADGWNRRGPGRRQVACQGSKRALQGLRNVHLVERVRCIAPLQRVFQNWVQQLYQLLVKYNHIEALQTALELVMLHGGFLDLMDSILDGTHYTLAVRGLTAPEMGQGSFPSDTRAGGGTISLAHLQRDVDPCLHLAGHSAIRRADSDASSQSNEWMMGKQQEQLLPSQQARLLPKQRDVDRNFGISGVPLLGFEELLCLLYRLIRPHFAPHLAAAGTLARVHAVVLQLHARNATRVSMARALAAAGLLNSPRRPDPNGPPGEDSSMQCCCDTSPGRAGQGCGPGSRSGSRPSSARNLRSGMPSRASSPRVWAGHDRRPGTSDDDVMGSSFDTKKGQFEGWQAALEGDKVLPRLNYWVLLSCSCIKRGWAYVGPPGHIWALRAHPWVHLQAWHCSWRRREHRGCCVAGTLRVARLAEERLTAQAATSALMETYTLLPPASTTSAGTPGGPAVVAGGHGEGIKDTSPAATVGVAPGGITSMRTATAIATEKVLEESSQASLLHQHTRALLIACKSSGVQEAQLLEPLAHAPHLLAPALQLRTMPTCLSTMTPEAVAITRTAGMEIAAAAVVQGTASMGACTSESPPPFLQAQSTPSTAAPAIGKRTAHPNSLADATGPAVTKPSPMAGPLTPGKAPTTPGSTTQPSPLARPLIPTKAPTGTGPIGATLAKDPAQHPPSTKPPSLAPLNVPSDPMQPSPASTPNPAHDTLNHYGQRTGAAASSLSTQDAQGGSLSPAAVGRKPPPRLELPPGSPLAPRSPSPGLNSWGKPDRSPHAQERQQQLGLALQPWECNASVLCVGEPATKLWLQADNLERQVKQAQLVLNGLLEASEVLSTLPTSQMPSIVSKEYRPFLLGCCNMECSSHVPGRTEKEVHLHRCKGCGWVSYCSLECKEADLGRHQGFCEWQNCLQSLK